ncbi:type I restriction enzyme EcoKI subunit R [compost metagenome]
MTYQLRPYQAEAVQAALAWIKKSAEPCLIEAATGAGKSLIVAELAKRVHSMSGGKHILCLAPSAELTVQNRDKYLLTGEPCSIYSASAGGRSLRHPVVFATPGTFKKVAERVGQNYALVIIDECHGITATIQRIIEDMRKGNPRIRVIGLSATPYRLREGYIYRIDESGRPNPESSCRDPYFTSRVYRIGAHALLEQGYLTPVSVGVTQDHYDTSGLVMTARGQWDANSVDQAFVGHGRKTSAIVADVIAKSANRRGVMFFAATRQHAKEIMASLPPELSRMVDGETPKTERDQAVEDYKAQRFKYLVNVAVFTTGFDAPHVDVIALFRKTESAQLLQQIIGRGLRLFPDKKDVLLLDYAENIDDHFPDGDIFSPEIKAAYRSAEAVPMRCNCPDCGTENEFTARPNDSGFECDEFGYFVDLDGNQIETEHGPMPAHYGRRCQGLYRSHGGAYLQCGYRWTSKDCPGCGAPNDIAARYCSECKAELVDPNEKLKIEFKQLKRDPTRLQTDEVLSCVAREVVARSGNVCMRVDYVTPYRQFSVWLHPNAHSGKRYAEWHQWLELNGKNPQTVTYRKDPTTSFYIIHDYNRPADEIPS